MNNNEPMDKWWLDSVVTSACDEIFSVGLRGQKQTTQEYRRVMALMRTITNAVTAYKTNSVYISNDDPSTNDAAEYKNSEAYPAIEKIARETMDVETLQTRMRDGLDFYDMAVWNIRKGLIAAYEAGKEAAQSAHNN